MSERPLRVALIGCGLIGAKRAEALGPSDTLVGCHDLSAGRLRGLRATAWRKGVRRRSDELLALDARCGDRRSQPRRARGAHTARAARPAPTCSSRSPPRSGSAQVEAPDRCRAAQRATREGRLQPPLPSRALARAAARGPLGRPRRPAAPARHATGTAAGSATTASGVQSRRDPGAGADRPGYAPARPHALDRGPAPLHSALLRTQFWDTPVEDNAALILGESRSRTAPWAMLHVSWTEWKNMFSMEIYCRTAKLQVDGLAALLRSPAPEHLHDAARSSVPLMSRSSAIRSRTPPGRQEWEHFSAAIRADDGRRLLGDLADALYAWSQVEAAYEQGPYAEMRQAISALSGHVVITGGSSGIGFAIASALAGRGTRLTLIARRDDVLRDAVQRLPGDGHRALAFDVSDEAAWEGMPPQLERRGWCAAARTRADRAEQEMRARRVPPRDRGQPGGDAARDRLLPAPLRRQPRSDRHVQRRRGGTAPLRRYDAYASSKAAVGTAHREHGGRSGERRASASTASRPGSLPRMHRQTIAGRPGGGGRGLLRRTEQELASGGVPVLTAVALVHLLGDESRVPFTGRPYRLDGIRGETRGSGDG